MSQETVWVWDLYPLAKDCCSNWRERTSSSPGSIIERTINFAEQTLYLMEKIRRPETPRPPFIKRKFYIPLPEDLEILRCAFPDADSENPDWLNIEERLILEGNHNPETLAAAKARILVAMLGKLLDGTGQVQQVAKRPRMKKAEWLARAMIEVKEHPELPDAEIAKRAGVSPSTLSRSQEYQMAAAMAREPPRTLHGHVNRTSGTVEAYYDDE